jgi:asparagine synthase (glutamine-hydrolysing)
MAGVAGAYQQVDGEHLVRQMSERLSHRGPDDDGFYAFASGRVSAYLAHRRLCVIDRPGGHQPFVKHRLVLSYNGEIYNYRELRAQLTALGATFTTSSDTEVVLEAWRRWGPGCLRKFRGMFAFALFDEHSGSLYLARDHLGIKPMHFLPRKDGVVFASEMKALVGALGNELEMDPAGMVASLLYYCVPDRHSTVHRVQKLQPGTCAEFRPDGSCRVRTYFDIAEVAAAAAASTPIDLTEVIQESVTAHLGADVPVASLLSGGLDSGIVTVLAKRANPDVDAYTVVFPSEEVNFDRAADDSAFAPKIARRNQIDLHEIRVVPDLRDLLPKLVGIMDEPIVDPSAVSVLLSCQAARAAGNKVVLSGLGADDLFGALSTTEAYARGGHPAPPGSYTRRVLGAVSRHLPTSLGGLASSHARSAPTPLTFPDLPAEEAFCRSYSLSDPVQLAQLLSPELWPDIDDLLGEHLEIYCDNFLNDHVNRMCLAHARVMLPGLELAYTDRASMATSTELRLPFVDPVVFRAAFSLGGDRKVDRHKDKLALREISRAWLPENVVNRRGRSTAARTQAWVRHDLTQMVDEDLLDGELVRTGFIQEHPLRALVAEDRNGRRDNTKQIWQLLTLEFWYRQVAGAGVGL